MSVKIQLKQRKYTKNDKIFDIIVKSKKTLEVLGYYKPEGNWSFLKLDLNRFIFWVKNGALCSKRVIKLLQLLHNKKKEVNV